MKKLILHIPHSSTNFPFVDGFISNEIKIKQEIVKLTDWYTDELFYSEHDTMIVTPFSRLFCDVERFKRDEDEIMSKVGMGATYELFDDGSLLRTLTSKFRETIIEGYYDKHHSLLNLEVKRQLEKNGKVLILDCHSFSSIPFIRDLNQNSNRPDFNIGTDPYHTPKELINISKQYFIDLGYSCEVDWPYSGSIVPLEYYKKNKNVNSIMLEVNRSLYLNEPTKNKSINFEHINQILKVYIELIRNFNLE